MQDVTNKIPADLLALTGATSVFETGGNLVLSIPEKGQLFVRPTGETYHVTLHNRNPFVNIDRTEVPECDLAATLQELLDAQTA